MNKQGALTTVEELPRIMRVAPSSVTPDGQNVGGTNDLARSVTGIHGNR